MPKTRDRLEHLYEIAQELARTEDVDAAFARAISIAARTLPLASAMLVPTGDDGAAIMRWPADASPPVLRTDSLVVPLIVAHRAPLGVVKVAVTGPLDSADSRFIHAITDQLAVAVDRGNTSRRNVARRIVAETSSDKYEALAAENARLYEEARKAIVVREQILAVVSHDLRNPLSTIVMTANGMADPGGREERRKGTPIAAARIKRSADRMLRLIQDLLDFASIETESLAMKCSPQEPTAIVAESLAGFQLVAKEKDLSLISDVQADLPFVHCDRDRLLQVLANLVGNATKATESGSQVTVRVRAHASELVFAVIDHGPGISEADVPHLFDRYWRGATADYAGNGLGLAIARGIVHAHGGRIWAESELGRGASIFFTIPVAAGPGAEPACHPSAMSSRRP